MTLHKKSTNAKCTTRYSNDPVVAQLEGEREAEAARLGDTFAVLARACGLKRGRKLKLGGPHIEHL